MSVDKKEKNKGGRPEHVPTEKNIAVVRALRIAGRSIKYIAGFLGISDKTLTKHYQEIIDVADWEVDKDDEVEMGVYYNATIKKDFRAQAWWLERRRPKQWGPAQNHSEPESARDILEELVDKLPN